MVGTAGRDRLGDLQIVIQEKTTSGGFDIGFLPFFLGGVFTIQDLLGWVQVLLLGAVLGDQPGHVLVGLVAVHRLHGDVG
jgi:ABC-type protease/lipase transport system fused ATPase/permease subunit